MSKTIDNRRPITFEQFYRMTLTEELSPDTNIYRYDKNAARDGLDPWRLIEDWDLCIFYLRWFDNHEPREWTDVVWINMTDKEIESEKNLPHHTFNFRGVY